ncbi:uncharacterized protein LOC115085532 isoform X3 [Rhinatrema bivittatum]|uniref:uncharacterized protein LOC115085532 isoform X3 n=1 Tax=Rhinatrema bivittatum TaxID=194408 RepID=UPI001129AC6B|nr:uncharacterized protein LOC115085532 isoform X3 [Rhinatrema bivittatum]
MRKRKAVSLKLNWFYRINRSSHQTRLAFLENTGGLILEAGLYIRNVSFLLHLYLLAEVYNPLVGIDLPSLEERKLPQIFKFFELHILEK